MKRVIEVNIKEGPFCCDNNSECTFFMWGDGGFYQHCCLYNEDLKVGRFNDEGMESSFGYYRTRKCSKCI